MCCLRILYSSFSTSQQGSTSGLQNIIYHVLLFTKIVTVIYKDYNDSQNNMKCHFIMGYPLPAALQLTVKSLLSPIFILLTRRAMYGTEITYSDLYEVSYFDYLVIIGYWLQAKKETE